MKHFNSISRVVFGLSLVCSATALHAQTPTNYDVSVRINIEQGDAGICFASPDNSNFVLFQFKSGKDFMRPHSRVNDSWAEYHDAHYPDGFTLQAGKDYTVRISVTDDGKKATTYIAEGDGSEIKVNELVDDRYNFSFGRVGVRQSYDGDTDDRAYFDDFTVSADNKVLYSEDFSDPAKCSFRFGDTFEIRDGRLYADGRHDEYFGWQVIEADETKNFKVECDFEIKGVAAGIIWNALDESNFHMWQFNVERTPSQFRPHVWTSNGVSAKDVNVDIVTDHVYHLLIDVINGGKTAVTYLDGNKIDERDGNFVSTGKLGIRASYAENDVDGIRPPENSYFDNFRVTDHSGSILFEEDFSNPSAVYFSDGDIENGRLHIVGPSEGETRVWQTMVPNSLTTEIATITAAKEPETVNVYNIQGMLIRANIPAAEISALPAGLYIINGKKIAIR